MTSLERLITYFEKFPGIGSRQARRFAFHLLTEPMDELNTFAETIRTIKSTVSECHSCFRFYTRGVQGNVCPICSSESRDRSKLCIVERDSDVDAIERSRTYDGLYFILGGTVPLLEAHDVKKLRGGALKNAVETRSQEGLKEIILGFSVNPDGENTARYIETLLRTILDEHRIVVSYLGRGLSTGSELEYADSETIKNALIHRTHNLEK